MRIPVACVMGAVGLALILSPLHWDPRPVLLLTGLVLSLFARKPRVWLSTSVRCATNRQLLTTLLPVMGFVLTLKATGCNSALVQLAEHFPGTLPAVLLGVALTFALNVVLLSASATATTVGVVVIPLLIARGIEPGLAAAVVLCGTWGAVLSIASSHASAIGMRAGMSARDVITNHFVAAIIGLGLVAGTLGLESFAFAHSFTSSVAQVAVGARSSHLAALMPFAPVAVVLSYTVFAWLRRMLRQRRPVARDTAAPATKPARLSLAVVMVAASVLTVAVTRVIGPYEAVASFVAGMWEGYTRLVLYIVAGAAFVAGLESNGVIAVLVTWLKRNPRSVAWVAMGTTASMSALSGSSDATVMSFNLALTEHANEMAVSPSTLGSLAWLGGELGRCLSPFSAATLAVVASARNAGVESLNSLAVVGYAGIPVLFGLVSIFCVLQRRLLRGSLRNPVPQVPGASSEMTPSSPLSVRVQ